MNTSGGGSAHGGPRSCEKSNFWICFTTLTCYRVIKSILDWYVFSQSSGKKVLFVAVVAHNEPVDMACPVPMMMMIAAVHCSIPNSIISPLQNVKGSPRYQFLKSVSCLAVSCLDNNSHTRGLALPFGNGVALSFVENRASLFLGTNRSVTHGSMGA